MTEPAPASDLRAALSQGQPLRLDQDFLTEAEQQGRALVAQGRWAEAAQAFAVVAEGCPWAPEWRALMWQGTQLDALQGEELQQGLGPHAYAYWVEHVEPRLPAPLTKLKQSWWLPQADGGWRALHAQGVVLSSAPRQGWLLLVNPDVRLRLGALQALEAWLEKQEQPQRPQALSCDEDRLSPDGERHDPWFKPDWVPESFWSTPWLESFSCWDVSWWLDQGLPLPPQAGPERFGWLLQALERQPRLAHVPQVLAHRLSGQALPGPQPAQQRAALLQAHLRRSGEPGVVVEPHPQLPEAYALHWPLPQRCRCTVIVPTRDKPELLGPCLEGLETAFAAAAPALECELIVVDNGSQESATAELLQQWQERLGPRLRVLRDEQPFNWSALNNAAAAQSSGDLLLFLNNDTRPGGDAWLQRLAAQALRPAVGCAGALLLYRDGSVQHGGTVLGMHHLAGHAYVGLSPQHLVHRGRLQCLSAWGAVTGACLMVRRSLFERLGGFDEAFPVEGNDVEFCLRLDALGYRHVVDPAVCFPHYESQSRQRRNTPTQQAAMQLIRARWGERLRSSAPWWPQACSPHHSDGRPLGLEHLL